MYYISEALEKGLGCGLQVGADATRMWMSYLIYLRRQIRWQEPHKQELIAFREAAQQALAMIDKCKIKETFFLMLLYGNCGRQWYLFKKDDLQQVLLINSSN